MTTGYRLAFIGGGNMAEALIKGVLASEAPVTPEQITVGEPDASRRTYLADTYGVATTDDNGTLLARADLVFLAVKPHLVEPVLVPLQDHVTDQHLIISLAAGVPLTRLQAHLYADSKVVRVMPNTPALVGQGVSALSVGPGVTDKDLLPVQEVLGAVGLVVTVAEAQMDAVTALSGSGPAYVFTFIEALADGGVQMGLPRATAMQLAAQTVLGAAQMVRDTGTHPAQLKDMVTSPGGTTAAGLSALETGAFRGVVMAAVKAATERGRELGA